MESEATIPVMTNGVEKTAPLPESVTPLPTKTDSVGLGNLMEKREKMIQGLNSVKAQREALQARLKEMDLSISRTEGAIYGYETLIYEIDPSVLQQAQGV